jgi:replicative superfamily II helicase
MSLHPIKALDHVLEEYRDYLLTEFRAKDQNLRAALERELDAPRFLAQEPFFQAHRPFKTGKAWRELPLDQRLAQAIEQRSGTRAAYLHQSQAIDELRSANPQSIVVTTGTGSGKTEAFLLPVIQNAFDDAVRFKKHGLTAILIYPMNALANDQKLRIDDFLESAGFTGAVRCEQYDRGTSQAKRAEMRANPPHILLTNYMMLEYLLVRPADRENIFANHRCRFLVLDEVHTYRGTLGSNIALLIRRLRVHLARARQDWRPNVADAEQAQRFPQLVPVGTSATIKSVDEEGRSREEIIRLRDEAVQEFFGTLVGVPRASIRVFGEELQDVPIPAEAHYPAAPGICAHQHLDVSDPEAVRKSLCSLAGLGANTTLADAARQYRLLWDLNHWLIRRPMSLSNIVAQMKEEVPERKQTPDNELLDEVTSALVIGGAIADDTAGALRLRAHRFIRGGWKFYRCINPACGRLFPKGEEQCATCNHRTAPVYLCRNCGADYLRFVGDFAAGPLAPSDNPTDGPEWLLYEPGRFDLPPPAADDADDLSDDDQPAYQGRRGPQQVPTQIKRRPVLDGSFDPRSLRFSTNPDDFSLRVTLSPARTRCLCCGGTAGSRSVITPLALGTSAAVKVLGEGLVESLAEANRDRHGHDGKERLLIFSDSRQDAAHQARFIIFSSRYDRMRRRLLGLLGEHKQLTIQKAVELLGELAEQAKDNPHVPLGMDWFNDVAKSKIQAYEEAPLLDEVSVNAGYRATVVNLGLVGVNYHQLDDYVRARGAEVAARLGIGGDELEHLCRMVLDEIRTRGALSRPMLQYHPSHLACPQFIKLAEWERQLRSPQGYPLTAGGEIAANLDAATLPYGIKHHNAWRKQGVGGRPPSLEGLFRNLIDRFGGAQPDEQVMIAVLDFLRRGSFLTPVELYGAREKRALLQVNAEVVRLVLLSEANRLHCEVCGEVCTGSQRTMPCSRCHGMFVVWSDADVGGNRAVKRVRNRQAIPLVAAEHTAQITSGERAQIEDQFKAGPDVSPVNLLSCSPTLEMGIDVGGLDAVVLRNVPPRPDNYAQRGGRAGRRSRVGMVVGYARNTPHDQYFYDKPREMIAGEVPAPSLNVGNRDVILRHLYAIVFGAADPGLSGKMVDYVAPSGTLNEEAIGSLIEAVNSQREHAIQIATEAWGADVFTQAQLTADDLRKHLETLADRVRRVFESTGRQVIELRAALDRYAQDLQGRYAGVRAGELVARLLGIPSDQRRQNQDADDRSAGYPLRRFAEFGLLPGYEFPSEPASLRLMGDPHEEEPISVTRRFGIGQFQPEAHVYARSRRWKVIGLDTSSPWNPQSEGPSWNYRLCARCNLRYHADQPRCPRCRSSGPGVAHPAYEFAGFLARQEERPILDEEDRFAARNLVRIYPQWDGSVAGRFSVGPGWALRLSRNEEVRWVNEGLPPSANDLQAGLVMLHPQAKGYLLCPACGYLLEQPAPPQPAKGGRRNARGRQQAQATNGHSKVCPLRGNLPSAVGITTSGKVEVLRLLLPVPHATPVDSWGLSVGFALLSGIQHHFMLGSGEVDFELEGPWDEGDASGRYAMVSLAFIDPSLGGSGYLERVAENLHHVASRAIDHLDHRDCETACYRCLKSYYNQRYHEQLAWPQTLSALEELRQQPPQRRPLETGDIDDPRPWLEAYAAGVGSPLELKFLRLFERHGFHPEKQVRVSPSAAGAPISVADFAVVDRRIAIYVDGAAFHVGDNLRRDRYIRDRLRAGSPPWRVVELRAADLSRGAELVREING